MKTILITGANGFVGSALRARLQLHGLKILGLVRTPKHDLDLGFDLGKPIDDRLWFLGPDTTVIHCAQEMHGSSPEQIKKVNVQGTKALYEVVRRHNAKFIYISSMAAHENARSSYGQGKNEVEQFLDLSRDLVIKPGTIVGSGGLFERLTTLLKKIPIVPVFYARSALQTISIEDLTEALVKLVENDASGIKYLAHPKPVSIQTFYRDLIDNLAVKRVMIPMPGDLFLPLLRFTEYLGIKLPITSDNLLGLKFARTFDTEADQKNLGMTFKSYDQSLRTVL